MKLSVCLIVKNEEAVLDECLRSVAFADEIIIVDTGSTDETINVARTYTDKIYTDYKWADDFAEARNYAVSKATGDYILSIDADEILQTPIEEIKKQLLAIGDYNALLVTMRYDEGHSHRVPRLFKNGLKWYSACHEYIACNSKDSNIEIIYRKSPSHLTDPDRNIRILEKSLEAGKNPRDLFYLAREYWDRQDYTKCLSYIEDYLPISTWKYEKSDAYLTGTRCLFQLQQGDKARNYCLKAIMLNPNFKEALEFMAEISWEKEAIVWKKFSDIADNSDVLFIRK